MTASPPGSDPSLPPEERAREICLRALERRRRTRRELADRLRRKGIPDAVHAPVLDRLTEVGLIDDEAYARVYVEERQRTRPRGTRALASELAAKGIDREIIERVLEERRDEADPVAEARTALASKLRGLRGVPVPDARRKAAAFLQRRGFSWDVVREALDRDLPEGEAWDEP